MSISGREVKARRASMLLAFAFALLASTSSAAKIPARMLTGLTSTSVKVRVIAVAAISKTRAPEAADAIRPMLGDPESVVRAAAVDGLVLLKDASALDAIAAMKDDPDAGLRAVVGRAIAALEKMVIQIDTGDIGDLSGKATPALLTRLQTTFETELRKLSGGIAIRHGGVGKGYGAILKVRTITKGADGGNEFIEVKCDLTLVELPGKVLRVSASATAAAGVEGKLPPAMEPELARDGIDACAPSLAKDFSDYLEQHRGRR